MSRGGGADVIVVGDEDTLIETLEAGNVLWRKKCILLAQSECTVLL